MPRQCTSWETNNVHVDGDLVPEGDLCGSWVLPVRSRGPVDMNGLFNKTGAMHFPVTQVRSEHRSPATACGVPAPGMVGLLTSPGTKPIMQDDDQECTCLRTSQLTWQRDTNLCHVLG